MVLIFYGIYLGTIIELNECIHIILGLSNGSKNTGLVGKIKSKLNQAPDLTASEEQRKKRAEQKAVRKARRGEGLNKVIEGQPQPSSEFAGVFQNQMQYFSGNDD